ncbi:ATP-binding protein [Streptantibioticus silvisoli]|jgi:anti-sigma regulatory factor (Ser/Thr protein kinase)|uniref:ATP-binding protein n=1 Tax=Streptantibioticus silvisoli TaxID=2705255 RepID=A0ABT6W6U8_9ACTN|nr:ATP-binding protein [Streptantibioticus silvisoli]MDI5966470.1 ATP-binding protein [Streptantibioticus silvisoli]
MKPPSAADRGTEPVDVCLDLDGDPTCIARARDAATAYLARRAPYVPSTFRMNLLLVVSELVTNAVRHAPGPLTLCLDLLPDGLDVSVEDSSPTPPQSRVPDPRHGPGGYGWPIVQRLARQVRIVPRHGGKAVHAVLTW